MTSIKLPPENAERDRLADEAATMEDLVTGELGIATAYRDVFIKGWNARPVRTPPPIEFDPDLDPKGYVLGAQHRIMCLEETIKVLSKMDPKDAESLTGAYARLWDENQEFKTRSVKDASAEELMGNPKVAALVETLEFYTKEENTMIDWDEHSNSSYVSEKCDEAIYNDFGFKAKQALAAFKGEK